MALNNPSESPSSVVTKLYQQAFLHWSEHDLGEKQEAALEKQMAVMPIVQRFVHCGTTWSTESFTINGPRMRRILLQVLTNYQDLDLELENWTFRSPYNPLVHRWQRLQDSYRDTFEELRTYHFMQYKGRKIITRGSAKKEEPASGRVVVDAFAYYASCKVVKPHLRPLDSDPENNNPNSDDDEDGYRVRRRRGSDASTNSSSSEQSTDVDELKLTVKSGEAKLERKEELTPLTD
ncbi:hypothetical protein J3F83DRAFT_713342 [Trichoderma novae-zelandiae]